MNEEVIFLGLDGMDIRFVREMMERGELENFQRLEEKGYLGELESCEPPVTVPAWATMFTGKTPGNLGAFHFQELVDGEFQPVDFTEFYGSYVWDTEVDSSVLFMPGVTPPYELENGIVTEGIPCDNQIRVRPEEEKYNIVTREEEQELLEKYPDKIKQAMKKFRIHKNVVDRVKKKYEQELLVVVFRPTDTVAHFADSKEDFYEVYREADKELGDFMDYAEENNSKLVVASDHGASETEEAFFMNTWLEKEGYLQLSEEGERTEKKLLMKMAEKLIGLGLRKPLEFGHSLVKRFTGKDFKPNKNSVSEQINWSESDGVAYLIGALPTTGIMLNEDKLGGELEEVREEIIEKLSEEEGIKWVRPREEVYKGEKVDKLPHIVVRGRKEIMMKSMLYTSTRSKFRKFGHSHHGLIGAYGGKISEEFSGPALEDIGPTVLSLMGKDVPRDMDGTPFEVFKDMEINFTDERIDNKRNKSMKKDEEIKNRLEELGYVGN